MQKTTLPLWLNGTNAKKLQRITRRLLALLTRWQATLINMSDARLAPLDAVNLHAQAVRIKRAPGESEALYRKRVHFAISIANRAGTIGGLKWALALWEIPVQEIVERDPTLGEDSIVIYLLNAAYSAPVVKHILSRTARACRQYHIGYKTPFTLPCHAFGHTLIMRYTNEY